MRRRWWVVLVLWVLGVAAPGCKQFAPDDEMGRICAQSASGSRFCGRADQDPGIVWGQAAAQGSMPISMWALWPSSVTIDDMARSEDKLRAWFADVHTALSYVRDTQRSAESYKASMDGIQGLLQDVQNRQKKILGQKLLDPAGRFKKAVTKKAEAEKDPLVAEIAADKQAMGDVQALFDKAKAGAAPLASAYAALVEQFTAYRATEAAETGFYASLSQEASGASLAELPAIEQKVVSAATGASSTSVSFSMNAMKLSAQLQIFEMDQEAAILSQKDFMEAHGAALPDMTSDALRSINAMLGYVQQRVTRSDATAIALANGITMRRKALELLGGSPFKAAEVAKAKRVEAGAVFEEEVMASLAAVLERPSLSTKLKLPHLAARYDQLTRLVQMKPLCAATSASFREAGCSVLRGRFDAATTALRTKLPAMIASGLATMRARGADPRALDAAQRRLDAGDIKGAALAHDAAVRSMEGT